MPALMPAEVTRRPASIARAFLHRQRRKAVVQIAHVLPVGGDGFGCQHAAGCQQEGTGADRGGDLRLSSSKGNPVQRLLASHGRINHAARRYQQVAWKAVGKATVGQYAQAGSRLDRLHRPGHAAHLKQGRFARMAASMQPAGGGEDFVRLGKVQRLDRIEHQDGNLKAYATASAASPARASACGTLQMVAKRSVSTAAVRALMSDAASRLPSRCCMSQVSVASGT